MMPTSDPTSISVRLRRLRHLLLDLVAELQIVAERAEMYSTRRPRRSGSPHLESHREHLGRLHVAAVGEVHRDRGEPASVLREVLTVVGESPPRPVIGEAYVWSGVLRVVQIVRQIGWDDGPGVLRSSRDPWHRRTPAERLSGAERWTWQGVSLPYFGDPEVVAEFTAALIRVFDRAEAMVWAANGGASNRPAGGLMASGAERQRSRPTSPSAGRPRNTTPNGSGMNRHSASEAVRAAVLSVFQPAEVINFTEVFKRMRGDRGDWSSGHIRHALSQLAMSDDGRLVRVSNGRYALAEKKL